MCPRERLVLISISTGLSFAKKGLGHLLCLFVTSVTCSLFCCLVRKPLKIRLLSIHKYFLLWHPAKTITRKSRCFCALHHHDRMLMSSCHITFEHRHHLAFACIKLFAEKPVCVFLNAPSLFKRKTRVSGLFCFICYRFAKARF